MIYYHGRNKRSPYKGKYIFITDSLEYASLYAGDDNQVLMYTIPFEDDKLFSIKNPTRNLLKKHLSQQAVDQILKDSGQEIDWAALSYISCPEFDTEVDFFNHYGFYGVRVQERTEVESIYIFDERNLKPFKKTEK
jgi:hypothetical protein